MDHLRVDPGSFQIPGMHAPPLTNPPPQIFGSYGMPDGLPLLPPELQMAFDPTALMGDDQDAKRRRIARVSGAQARLRLGTNRPAKTAVAKQRVIAGLRHVQEEEDQVRRQATGLHTLH
jgi:hypothetical protein